ncbi:MAG: hypothetical protein PVG69_12025 [Desulfobacterales bacterium]|jgi:hypothetical protein
MTENRNRLLFVFCHLFSVLISAEPFGPEPFDPESTTEGLTAERLVAGCPLYLPGTALIF